MRWKLIVMVLFTLGGSIWTIAYLVRRSTAPNDKANTYHSRAIAWYEKGDYDKAIADYDKLIRLDPGNEDAYNGRGMASQ